MSCFTDAVFASGIPAERHVCVSGIGCTGRVAGYLSLDSFHTTHGRAIPYAIGLKAANPDLQVSVISGDGDLSSIGGNHLIHAARRNLAMTCLLLNNQIYGMTGGQFAPTTGPGKLSTTSPTGQMERAFDSCRLAEAAGATFVARGITYEPEALEKLITTDHTKHNKRNRRDFSFPAPVPLAIN